VIYGDQTYNIPPGGGAMFELQVPDAGLYPFVTHAFAYTGLGSVGVIKIDPNAAAAPASYPMMGDPFSAGVKPFTGPAGGTQTPPATGGGTGTGTGSAASCSPKGTDLTLMAEGMKFGTELVIRGARERLSPILMTSLATGLALVPLVLLGARPGHEIEHPLAVVVLGGLATSTLLNLLVLPSLYLRFGRSRREREGRGRRAELVQPEGSQ